MKNIYKIRFIISTIIFLLIILAFSGVFYPIKVLDIQLGALLERIFVDFSLIALILFSLIILITILFGRFYCSIICPFGYLQELAGIIFKPKNRYIKNCSIKYYIMALVFGFLIAQNIMIFKFIEPYSLFGAFLTASITGIILTLAVFAIVFFKNRFFCTNICPIGTFLGLISKNSLFKIRIDKNKCVSCQMCEKNCPSSCINSKEKTINNEPCVKCLKCISTCSKNALSFSKKTKENIKKFSIKRRQIIISSSVILFFGVITKGAIILKDKITEKIKDIILPAGAISKEEFINKCFNCNLCVENCPNKILVKADENFPSVHIDYSKGEKLCKFDCKKCSEICPTGAIKRISLKEKQKTRIAIATIIEEKCAHCNNCVNNCPSDAIIKQEGKMPIINSQKCIGCAACKNACNYEAIEIFPIKKQKEI